MTGKFHLRKFYLGKFHQENSTYGNFHVRKIPPMDTEETIAKYAVDANLFRLGSTNPKKKIHPLFFGGFLYRRLIVGGFYPGGFCPGAFCWGALNLEP